MVMNKKLILLILVGLSLRLFLAFAFYGNFDQESYEIVAGIIRHGGNIYAETSRYNYSPIWSYLLYTCELVSNLFNLPMHFVVRGVLSFADLGNAALIWRMSNRRNALIYWLNPVSILLVGYHGQFETLAIFPLLLAVYARQLNKSGWIGWLLGSLSMLIKHIMMPGIWSFYQAISKNKLQSFITMLGSILVFLLSFLPYLPDGKDGIIKNVLLYQSVPGRYGLTSFLHPWIVAGLFAGVMLVLPMILKDLRLSITKSIEIAFISFLVFAPGIGEQYFLLPLAWSALNPSMWFYVYSAAVTAFLLASKNNLAILNLPPMWNLVWVIAVLGLMFSFRAITPLSKKEAKSRQAGWHSRHLHKILSDPPS